MDKLSMAIVAMDAHVACTNDRLKQAWEVIHAELVDGQKPTTNIGSTKLLGFVTYALDAVIKGDCKSAEPYLVRAAEQLRASA